MLHPDLPYANQLLDNQQTNKGVPQKNREGFLPVKQGPAIFQKSHEAFIWKRTGTSPQHQRRVRTADVSFPSPASHVWSGTTLCCCSQALLRGSSCLLTWRALVQTKTWSTSSATLEALCCCMSSTEKPLGAQAFLSSCFSPSTSYFFPHQITEHFNTTRGFMHFSHILHSSLFLLPAISTIFVSEKILFKYFFLPRFTTISAYVSMTVQVQTTGTSYGEMESTSDRSEKGLMGKPQVKPWCKCYLSVAGNLLLCISFLLLAAHDFTWLNRACA